MSDKPELENSREDQNEAQNSLSSQTESTSGGEKVDKALLNEAVVEVLKGCYDPEIPVNIYELGLIYGIYISDEGVVDIEMTLTSPACPVAGSLPPEVEAKVKAVKGVKNCVIRLVWDPQWDMSMMSEEARLHLNLY